MRSDMQEPSWYLVFVCDHRVCDGELYHAISCRLVVEVCEAVQGER